jgi:DNA-directed RNA polymerase II subunit RPB2
MEKDTLEVLNAYFKENPNWPVKHHLDSYNDFIDNKIPLVFKNKNKASVIVYDKEDRDIEYQFDVYIGKKSGTHYRICPPVLHDYETGTNKQLYPNEARLRNLTYGFDIFYDSEIEVSMRNRKTGKVIIDKHSLDGEWLNNNYLGNIPIMVNSNMCILNKLPKEAYTMIGEAPEDVGGYFILDGAEKVVISQERKAENMIYTIAMNDSTYSMHTIVKSKSDESFDLARDNTLYLDHQGRITVCIGPKDKPLIQRTEDKRFIPLFVMFRMLGVESDREIVEMILGTDYNNEYNVKLLNLLRESIKDPLIRKYNIYDQKTAEVLLERLVTRSTVNIKSDDTSLNEFKRNKEKHLAFLYDTIYEAVLPHSGRNFRNKAMFLGLMVRKLLMTHIGLLTPTNRDSFMNKRFDVSGVLMSSLFSRAFQRGIVYNATREIRTIYEFATNEFMGENIVNLINEQNINDVFKSAAFREYFNDNLKVGNMGFKKGVVQQMERISYYNMISQLRRIVLPTYDAPRVSNERRHVQTNQFGYICTQESPEGGKIGLTLALALLTTITIGYPPQQLRELCISLGVMDLHRLTIAEAHKHCKVMINGNWIGCILQPDKFVKRFRLMRRNGLINTMTSISWYIEDNEIYIYCDDGRLSRPLYIYNNNNLVLRKTDIAAIKAGKISFTQLLTSRLKRTEKTDPYKPHNYLINMPKVLGLEYTDIQSDEQVWNKLRDAIGGIEYLDIKEMDNALLSLNFDIEPNDQYTYSHADIHPIIILGYMALYGFLLNHGSGGKYLASGASKHPKQSVSLYTTAFQHRFDTSAHLAHSSERAIIQNRFHHIINNHIYGTGDNVIVAISYHNGFNQEDAFIFNKTSIEMGRFNSSYYKMYQSSEKADAKTGTEERFYNPMYADEVEEYPEELAGNKGKYTFEHLDKFGMVKEGTYLTGHEVLIGKYAKIKDASGNTVYTDLSSHTKPDNKYSYVDKVFTCKTNAQGDELCKVRTCQLRLPQYGDKFASRNGQKGTVGLMMRREDMPSTASGIIPDIIMHPTSYPKRMTLNQLFEIIYGKLACQMGFFGQANTFEPFDVSQINEAMEANGFTYGGDEFMYDGSSGKMMPYKIFIGPLYVQRLKLMVNDKINARTSGFRRNGMPVPGAGYTTLDRSVVPGRAAGGGLKIGEMERDALIAHGVSSVIYDRDMIRGDKFEVFVSPINGQIVIANEGDNIFYDDLADGPISYHLAEGTGQGKRAILGINTLHKKQHKFNKVNIPYSTKLLIQEMMGAGYNVKIKPQIHKIMVDANKFADTGDEISEPVSINLQPTDIFADADKDVYSNKVEGEMLTDEEITASLPEMPQERDGEFLPSAGIVELQDPAETFIQGLNLPDLPEDDEPPTYDTADTYPLSPLQRFQDTTNDTTHTMTQGDVKSISMDSSLLTPQEPLEPQQPLMQSQAPLMQSQEPQEQEPLNTANEGYNSNATTSDNNTTNNNNDTTEANNTMEEKNNQEGGSNAFSFIPVQYNETANQLQEPVNEEEVKSISVSSWM